MTKPKMNQPVQQEWMLYVNELSNGKGIEVSVILEGSNDIVLEDALKFDFKETNNQAKYEALVAKL